MKNVALILSRLLIVALLIGLGLAFYDPTIIPNKQIQGYFATIKSPETAEVIRQTTLGISQTAGELIEKPPLIPQETSQLMQQSAQSYAQKQIDSVKVRICEELLGQKVVTHESTEAATN
jgi:hypothetical protein